MMNNKLLVATVIVFSILMVAIPAHSDTESAVVDQAETPGNAVSIDGLTDLSQANAATLGMAAEYANRNGNNPDKALILYRKALEKDNDDIDLHLHYAELLEDKFKKGGESDSKLYYDCLKEWLIVLRDEVGDEKGLTVHGVGLPFSGRFYNDEGRVILARKELIGLTGIAPKGWETDAKYLEKVAKRASVTGALLPKNEPNTPALKN